MDQDTVVSIGLVLVFILVGGVFAGTEMALVSLRESQVNRLQGEGPRGARAAAVAGYVISRLGRIARVGDTVTVGDRDLVVTQTDGNRLVRLQVTPAPG